jgi:hypothetical protein
LPSSIKGDGVHQLCNWVTNINTDNIVDALREYMKAFYLKWSDLILVVWAYAWKVQEVLAKKSLLFLMLKRELVDLSLSLDKFIRKWDRVNLTRTKDEFIRASRCGKSTVKMFLHRWYVWNKIFENTFKKIFFSFFFI